jgi:type II secretory pathway pseudopilin PulG
VTLVELLVVLMLIGLLAGVVGLTLGSTPSVAALDPVTARVMATRDSALRVGRPVTISIAVGRESHRATAFPDGRVLTDARLEIDALSGTASAGNASAGSTSSQRTTGDAMR